MKEQTTGELAEARQRIAELTIVNEIGRTISYASSLDDLLGVVHQQVSRFFDTTSFYIATHEEGSDEWMSVLDIERGERQSCARYGVGSGVTGHIIHSRQPVLWRSAEEGRAFLEDQRIEAVGEMALSWLGVPLIAADSVVGVMAIQSYERADLYDEHDLTVFSMIAAQVAPALATMRLLEKSRQAEEALQRAYDEVEKRVGERTIELQHATTERERLQQEMIEAQRQALQDLSTPIIPIMERIIVVPLVGSIDSMRARDITRALLMGIRQHKAQVVILDITGVPVVDSGVADHLNKTIQAARLKGARTIVTGISDAVAETIVDLGIDWGGVETMGDLQTGLVTALNRLGVKLSKRGRGEQGQ